MTHPNEEIVRAAYAAFARGDIPALLDALDPDIVWRVGGDSRLTGEYHGHDGVLFFLGRLMELSGGTFRLEVHDVLANDTHVVALIGYHAAVGDEEIVGLPGAHVLHVRDGKASAFWDCPSDQSVIDDLFPSRLGAATP